jgi:hypothetical protein
MDDWLTPLNEGPEDDFLGAERTLAADLSPGSGERRGSRKLLAVPRAYRSGAQQI